MILKKGDNIFVAHRGLFDGDAPRFFVGQVDDYEGGVFKARGYSYVRDEMSGLMIEKPHARSTIPKIRKSHCVARIPEESQRSH